VTRVLFVVNDAAFFLSHRLPIALAARKSGYEVHVATPDGSAVADVVSARFAHHRLPLSRSGLNPLQELRSLWAIYRLFRRLSPHVVHLVTTKPVLYGGIAARLAGVPGVLVAVPGLGFPFSDSGVKARSIRLTMTCLYRIVFRAQKLRVVVQNPHDRRTLLQVGAVTPDQTVLIPGSGVELSAFPLCPEPDGVPVVTLATRMLRNKGVYEFVEAARLLADRGTRARFWLVGAPDAGNFASVNERELESWREEGTVEVLGLRRDIPDIFAASNLVVLPSYYGEGLPKVLCEAAASGRAVITTDHPGCRDAIVPGVTGLLVPPRDAEALATAIRDLLRDTGRRKEMGRAGRRLAEARFSIREIVAAHMAVYRSLESDPHG
jgi:glycosyltransferase involved in cell wall biosynthesis